MFLKKLKISYYRRRALNCYVSSDFDKSAGYFQKILNLYPDLKGINMNLGLVNFAVENLQEATKYILKEIQYHGHSYSTDRAMADITFFSKQPQLAMEYYQRSLEYPECDCNDFLKERIKQCNNLELYQKALDSVYKFKSAVVHSDKKEYDVAEKLLKEAISCDAYNFNAYNNLGTIAMNIHQDYDRAVKFFNKAYAISKLPVIASNIRKVKKIRDNVKNPNI